MTLSAQTFVLLPGRSLEQSRPTTLYTHTYIQAYTMYVCLSAVAVSGLAVILGRRLQRMFFGLRI